MSYINFLINMAFDGRKRTRRIRISQGHRRADVEGKQNDPGGRVYVETIPRVTDHRQRRFGKLFEGGHFRTLTGVRDGKGNCVTMNSLELKRFFQVNGRLKDVGDVVDLDDDKGLFDPVTVLDVTANETRVWHL